MMRPNESPSSRPGRRRRSARPLALPALVALLLLAPVGAAGAKGDDDDDDDKSAATAKRTVVTCQDNTDCFNGGTCHQQCHCVNGYSGMLCQKPPRHPMKSTSTGGGLRGAANNGGAPAMRAGGALGALLQEAALLSNVLQKGTGVAGLALPSQGAVLKSAMAQAPVPGAGVDAEGGADASTDANADSAICAVKSDCNYPRCESCACLRGSCQCGVRWTGTWCQSLASNSMASREQDIQAERHSAALARARRQHDLLLKWQSDPEEKTMDPYARLNERHVSNDPFAAARRVARKEEDLPEILREAQQQPSSPPQPQSLQSRQPQGSASGRQSNSAPSDGAKKPKTKEQSLFDSIFAHAKIKAPRKTHAAHAVHHVDKQAALFAHLFNKAEHHRPQGRRLHE